MNTDHRYSHRPGTVADCEFYILIVSSDELFHETVLHDKVKTVEDVICNFSFLEEFKQWFDLLIARQILRHFSFPLGSLFVDFAHVL